ncbi:MAG: sulfur carrier protein ThiS [Planctomycetes bacterium]|nr:sulfur carrier protein ThiS [Planctomycetota bacterium]
MSGPRVLLPEAGIGGTICVEVNLDVVPRANHAERRLKAGDSIEVVSFVGGG